MITPRSLRDAADTLQDRTGRGSDSHPHEFMCHAMGEYGDFGSRPFCALLTEHGVDTRGQIGMSSKEYDNSTEPMEIRFMFLELLALELETL